MDLFQAKTQQELGEVFTFLEQSTTITEFAQRIKQRTPYWREGTLPAEHGHTIKIESLSFRHGNSPGLYWRFTLTPDPDATIQHNVEIKVYKKDDTCCAEFHIRYSEDRYTALEWYSGGTTPPSLNDQYITEDHGFTKLQALMKDHVQPLLLPVTAE